jgi:hypothetical protein
MLSSFMKKEENKKIRNAAINAHVKNQGFNSEAKS